jgi:hypothetical protein
MIEEPLDKMTYEQRDLAALRRPHRAKRRLHVHGEHLRFGAGKETLENFSHAASA